MGVTMTATDPRYSFDMGCGGFFNLRKNIALALDKEFGENYALLSTCHSPEQFEENDKTANRIITRKHLDKNYTDVLDFLYQSDCGGEISHKTCKKIYELIKDVDFGSKGFRYGTLMHNDYEEFKEFLKDCYSHRKKMRWY